MRQRAAKPERRRYQGHWYVDKWPCGQVNLFLVRCDPFLLKSTRPPCFSQTYKTAQTFAESTSVDNPVYEFDGDHYCLVAYFSVDSGPLSRYDIGRLNT